MRQIPLLTLRIALKYWESVVQKITKAGFSLGWVSAIDFEGRTNLDCGRTWLRKAFHHPRRGTVDCVRGTGTGDSRVAGEFIVVRLSPLSEIAVVLVGA